MSQYWNRSAWGAALLVLACAVHGAGFAAQSLSYPTKPVRIIVGNAPGGGTDAVARLVGQRLTERWTQPVVIDNRGGGVGVIAMELAARAAPDGVDAAQPNTPADYRATINREVSRLQKFFATPGLALDRFN